MLLSVAARATKTNEGAKRQPIVGSIVFARAPRSRASSIFDARATMPRAGSRADRRNLYPHYRKNKKSACSGRKTHPIIAKLEELADWLHFIYFNKLETRARRTPQALRRARWQ
ncbi:hypothetical protein [Methylocapsa aurea]|uniref:hypothetical protein n=1 Tax=Methylocapsa aurea TaxID=663610 RepID=UPI003D18888B